MELLVSLLGLLLLDWLIVRASGNRIPSTLHAIKEAFLPKPPPEEEEPEPVDVVIYYETKHYEGF